MPRLTVPARGFEWARCRPHSVNVQGFTATLRGVVPSNFLTDPSPADRDFWPFEQVLVRRPVSESSSPNVNQPAFHQVEQDLLNTPGFLTLPWRVQDALVHKKVADNLRTSEPDPPPKPAPPRTYDPLDPELPVCRQFAELRNEDDCLRFANRYGLLGIDPTTLDAVGLSGEPWSVWHECIVKVRLVLRTWDAFNPPQKERLNALHSKFKEDPPRTGAARQVLNQQITALQKELGEVMADRPMLQQAVGSVEQLPQIVTRELQQHVGAALVADPRHGGLYRLDYQPSTLLGVIWLQCARILMKHRDYRRCKRPICDRWIIVGSSGMQDNDTYQRKHSDYCREEPGRCCRAGHYQDRKTRVGQLSRDGHSLTEIADATGEPIAIVQELLKSYTVARNKKRARSGTKKGRRARARDVESRPR